jgi:RNA recognition motif-containing protein
MELLYSALEHCVRVLDQVPRSSATGISKRHIGESETMNIYAGNLSYDLTEEELREAFAAHGEVASAKIITDRDTGRSKGFGFVEMPDRTQAEAAVAALDGQELHGRALRVNEAKARSNDRRRTG